MAAKSFTFEPINYDPTHHWDDLSKAPLKFQTLRYDVQKNELEVLDQLLLPSTTEYIAVKSVEDAFKVIRNMNIRGAPLIATVALLGIAVDLKQKPKAGEDVCDYIRQSAGYLLQSRPTAINLKNELEKLTEFLKTLSALSSEEIKQKVQAYCYQLYTAEREENDLLLRHSTICVEHNIPQQPEKFNVMTICNTGALATSSLGTALGVIRALHYRSRLDRAFCLETRPYCQGARLTAYELVVEGIPHCLITDGMAAAAMQLHNIAAVLVGADQIAANGDTANKIGTYQLAVLAKHHQIPFYVVAPTSTINMRIQSGTDIVIEERKAEEMKKWNGVNIAPEETSVWNPAFDVTPAALISAILTEKGNVRPEAVPTLFQ